MLKRKTLLLEEALTEEKCSLIFNIQSLNIKRSQLCPSFVLNRLKFLFVLFHRLIRMLVYALAARFGLPPFPVPLHHLLNRY